MPGLHRLLFSPIKLALSSTLFAQWNNRLLSTARTFSKNRQKKARIGSLFFLFFLFFVTILLFSGEFFMFDQSVD